MGYWGTCPPPLRLPTISFLVHFGANLTATIQIAYCVVCEISWCRCQSINQSINQFISRHSTEARATVRLCRIKEKCLQTDLKCVNGWSSSTVQWKGVPKSRSSNWETTSSSVQVVRQDWQKLLCGWSQQARLTVWVD